ncbi:restriction endonuclease subunit S [Streptomyces albus]|uniref:restriction endonuclease subunit S n=1 Tax=Streptomyces albus TaxID=1888 RepID=UPI0033D38162
MGRTEFAGRVESRAGVSGIAEGEDAGALPEGWVWARLGELGEWYGGGTPSKSRPELWEGGTIPWLSPKDMGQEITSETRDHITEAALTESPVRLVPEGSVAIVTRSGVLEHSVPVTLTSVATTLNQDMKAVAPHQGIRGQWIAWGLRAFERKILDKCRKAGTTVASLSTPALMELPFPVPPLAEQHRIVEALEAHLSRLDAAVSAVERSARRSEQVWKAALNSVAQGGPARNPEVEYHTVGSVSDVSGGIQKQKKRLPLNNIYPFLRVANIARGALDLSEIHQIELFDGELDRHKLEPGDLLVVEGNGSPDQIGRAATWHGEISDTVHQNHLIRVRPGPSVVPRYLELIWNAPVVIDQLRQVARSTSGLYTLSTSKVKSVRIPVPTPEEQQRLAAWADELESHNEAAKRVLEQVRLKNQSLKQSLLHQAFTGRLVPQDPDDEPASVLLARIKEERTAQAAAAKPKRARRTGAGTKTKRSVPAARTHTAGPPLPPATSSEPLPANAVQPTFDVFQDQAPDQDETQDATK